MILLLYQLSYAADAVRTWEVKQRTLWAVEAQVKRRRALRPPLRSAVRMRQGYAPAAFSLVTSAGATSAASSSGRMRKMRTSSLRSAPSSRRSRIALR